MDAGQIQKLVEADLAQLAARATNPRATLGALGQKIVAAMESVEQQMADLDARAMEIPADLDAAGETLKKLEAVIAKAHNDNRPDLAAAAGARVAKQQDQIAALQQEGDSVDTQVAALEELLQKLQMKQVDIDGAIASAPPDVQGVVNPPSKFDMPPPRSATVPGGKLGGAPAAASTPAPAKPSASASAPAKPSAPARPAAPAPAAAPAAPKKGGDALDDEFAALFASENLSLDEIQLPKKSLKKAVVLPDSDDGIPDLVMVSEGELPDDATDEDRAPMPTAPQKGAKAAPSAPARPAAPPAGGKLSQPPATAQAAPAASKAKTPAKAAAPSDTGPKKGRVLLWVGGITVVGGGTVAVLHFVFNVFGLIPV